LLVKTKEPRFHGALCVPLDLLSENSHGTGEPSYAAILRPLPAKPAPQKPLRPTQVTTETLTHLRGCRLFPYPCFYGIDSSSLCPPEK